MWSLCLLLALGSPTTQVRRTVAVVPFRKGVAEASYQGLGTALADMVVTDLSGASGLQLVERTRLKALMGELQLSKSGFVDPKSAQKMGKGLGAQLIVTGTYSVLAERFVLDVRLLEVQSGAVLKAVRSEGKIEEFVAVEKDVVEKLLDRLSVKLSLAARRKLLIEAPTESVKALVSFGRGMEQSDEGRLKAARAAFEAALREDPNFAKASTALAELSADVQRAQAQEKRRYKDAKERSLYGALEQLTPLTARPKGFKDTLASRIDASIRQELLGRAGQHCLLYEELKHLMLRTEGRLVPFYDELPGAAHYDRYREGERRMDARGKALGLVGPSTFYGTRPGELMHAAGNDLASGARLLNARNLQPESFSHCMMSVLAQCHPPAVQKQEVEFWIRKVRAWGWGKDSLYTVQGEGPVTITVMDALELYAAYLSAYHFGVDSKVRTRIDAVLARHPEGDKDRRSVLSRIKKIVGAGKGYERRRATRLGRSPKQLLALAERTESTTFEGLCGGLQKTKRGSLENGLKRHRRSRRIARRESATDQLGSALGPMIYAGCFAKRPLKKAALLKKLRKDAKRRHPQKLEDLKCAKRVERLQETLERATKPGDQGERGLESAILLMHGLRTSMCVVP